jgi:hypothetical protein
LKKETTRYPSSPGAQTAQWWKLSQTRRRAVVILRHVPWERLPRK